MLSNSHLSLTFCPAMYLRCQTDLLLAVNFSSNSQAIFIEVSCLPWYSHSSLRIYIMKFIFMGLWLGCKIPHCAETWITSIK